MPSPFESYTFKMIQDAVGDLRLDAGASETVDFYDGEHWRDGEGWIGQRPPQEDAKAYSKFMQDVERAFDSENVVKEIADRHVAGVVGREPRWGFVPRTPPAQGQEQDNATRALMGATDATLTAWWDKRDVLAELRRAVTNALLVDRGPIRVFIPPGRGRDPAGMLRLRDGTDPLTATLDLIFVDALDPASCGVIVDPDTREEASVFTFERKGADGKSVRLAEISYLDDAGDTVLRIINDAGAVDQNGERAMPLGGHLLVFDLKREALITPQVRQGQKALNLALTQMTRNVNLAGSLERVISNASPPGYYTNTATGQPWQEGDPKALRKFVATPLAVGPSVTTFLTGTKIIDDSGRVTGYANPSVNYRDPVPVDTFVATRELRYTSILGQVGQLHALISKDATASGESRKQARAEFEQTLAMTKGALDAAGRWLLEVVLLLAASLTNQTATYAPLRCEFGATIDAGPKTADEEGSIINQRDKKLLSRETAMSELGRDDVDAEIARMDEEDEAQLAREDASFNRLTRPTGATVAPAQGGVVDPAAQLSGELGQGVG